MARHKHADLIHAWAEGAEIEIFSRTIEKWIGVTDGPNWSPLNSFRIKPTPKPDVVREVEARTDWTLDRHIDKGRNLRLTFSGETGELIKAEVLK